MGLYILLPLLIGLQFFCVYMLYRNQAVHRYLIHMLDEISEAADFDISQRRDWRWRLDAVQTVKYDDMVIKFWRPLDSFFPHREAITNMHMTKEVYDTL